VIGFVVLDGDAERLIDPRFLHHIAQFVLPQAQRHQPDRICPS
jgi:hypothetical protein